MPVFIFAINRNALRLIHKHFLLSRFLRLFILPDHRHVCVYWVSNSTPSFGSASSVFSVSDFVAQTMFGQDLHFFFFLLFLEYQDAQDFKGWKERKPCSWRAGSNTLDIYYILCLKEDTEISAAANPTNTTDNKPTVQTSPDTHLPVNCSPSFRHQFSTFFQPRRLFPSPCIGFYTGSEQKELSVNKLRRLQFKCF